MSQLTNNKRTTEQTEDVRKPSLHLQATRAFAQWVETYGKKVSQYFVKLGYSKPTTANVALRKFAEYIFDCRSEAQTSYPAACTRRQ